MQYTMTFLFLIVLSWGNRNKGKGNGAGLVWESQSHCFADEFGIPYTYSSVTDTHDDSDPWLSLIKKEVKVLFV